MILEKISYVYSETLFYSDNLQTPNADRLEYWCPDEDYDKGTHITERCRNKKMFVLELDSNDEFTILGTSIMLANALEEQDPVHLKVNEDLVVFEADVIERQKHYISSGYPDLRWINLNITSRTIESGIPQRVFDILACGGFCLTNYQPEIAELFEDGKELVMYTDIEDLLQKVEYYLIHEEERAQIAKAGYEKVRNCFSVKDRIAELINSI